MRIRIILNLILVSLMALFMNITYCASEQPGFQKKQKTEMQSLAELNALNEKTGQNALHDAITQGKIAHVQQLLDMGVSPDIKDAEGNSPLHLALETPLGLEFINTLLGSKAQVNVKNSEGVTPLGSAAETSDIDAMKLLLAAGANPNDPDNDGATPFTTFMNSWNNLDDLSLIEKLSLLQKIFAAQGHPLLADRAKQSPFSEAINNAEPEIILFFMQKFPIFPPRIGAQQTLIMQEATNMINENIKIIEDDLAQLAEGQPKVKKKLETIVDILKHPQKYLSSETEVGNNLKKLLMEETGKIKKPMYSMVREREINKRHQKKSTASAPSASTSATSLHSPSSKPYESKKD